MDAIIYTTNTGSAERYAKLLAQETGLPVYSFAEAKKQVFSKAKIIYLGWIMAGSVKGYAEAAKRYRVCAVCGVNVKKLHGIYRPMMEIMVKTMGKSLAEKADRTSEEDDMLDMMLHGGERVKAENLSAVLDWYRVQR